MYQCSTELHEPTNELHFELKVQSYKGSSLLLLWSCRFGGEIEKIWVGQGSSLILFTGSTSSLEPESQQLEAAAAGGGKKSKLSRKKNWEEQTINTIKGDESNKKINN